jgi:hypothetical protein
MGERMTSEVKFVSVTRVIDPKTRIHYLDAIDVDGIHWMATMEHNTEKWLCYDRIWYQDPQQPKTYS